MRLFTEEQEKFVIRNVPGRSNKELTELINNTFGLDLKVRQVKGFKHYRKLSSGLSGRFEKGHAPVNKGTKGLTGANVTSFKKGHKPVNYKAIGTERVNKYGYTLIKVSDEGRYDHRWRAKHKVLWESVNGPIPKGYKLLFGDGDKTNITIENLILVTDRQLAVLNRKNLIQNDVNLTKMSIILADLYTKQNECKKRLKESKKSK